MTSYITIGAYEFSHCHSFEYNTSWKTLADTGVIKMHNILGLLKAIKKGDPVEIYAGYDGELIKEFTGYVSDILPTTPVQIVIEDEMWQLKQQNVTMSFREIGLHALLKQLVPDVTIECPDLTLKPFRINDASKAKVLQTLKDEYLLTVYFRDKKLFVGLPYLEKGVGEVDYHFQKNANVGELTFKRSDDYKVKVKAISINGENKRIVKEYGDDFGDFVTLHFHNKTESELDALAKEQISRMKYDGYRGSFVGMGQPYLSHSWKANLMDDRYPERASSVYIDSVKVVYNSSVGFKRYPEAGRKFVNVG